MCEVRVLRGQGKRLPSTKFLPKDSAEDRESEHDNVFCHHQGPTKRQKQAARKQDGYYARQCPPCP